MNNKDYKEYFYSKLRITKNNEGSFYYLNIEHFKHKDDNEDCEYSIKWYNTENRRQKGEIININTSSAFSLMSCGWEEENDDL